MLKARPAAGAVQVAGAAQLDAGHRLHLPHRREGRRPARHRHAGTDTEGAQRRLEGAQRVGACAHQGARGGHAALPRGHARHERRGGAGADAPDGPADPLQPRRGASVAWSARASWRARRRRRSRPSCPTPIDGLPPLHPPRAARRRAHDRAVELPVSHRGQLGRAGADRRERRAAEAQRADAALRRALRRGLRRRGRFRRASSRCCIAATRRART